MEIGFIGLGKMGLNMVTRLRQGSHRVVVYDRDAEVVQKAVAQGCVASTSLADLVSKLTPPRAAWIMVPSGQATEETVNQLTEHLQSGDVTYRWRNTRFHDDVRRAATLQPKGINISMPVTSGGVWGLKVGDLPNGRWRRVRSNDWLPFSKRSRLHRGGRMSARTAQAIT